MPTYEKNKKSAEKYLATMDRITIRAPKESGIKEAIQAHADGTGESVNAFILRAIAQTMERDREIMSPAVMEYWASVKKSAE